MFDTLRQALEDYLNARTPPAERRHLLAGMKDTLVRARMGIDDLRGGVELTRSRLAAERRELETVQRRKTLAQGIGDAETVAVAERYERQHADRVDVLVRKLEVQERELAITEHEVSDMTAELKRAVGSPIGESAGPGPSGSAGGGVEADLRTSGAPDAEDLAGDLDALARQRQRTARDAGAEARLAEMKRRMGK